jgi:hypothetical protein
MRQRISAFVGVVLFLSSVYGCIPLLAGAAGGAGTAAWLSGKMSQTVNAPFEKTIKAAKSALSAMNLAIEKETQDKDIAQIVSKYTDGKTIWIDIRPVTETSSKIDVRVGAVNADKKASDKILRRIQRYL